MKLFSKFSETVKKFVLGQLNLNNRPKDLVNYTPDSRDKDLILNPAEHQGLPNAYPISDGNQLTNNPIDKTTGPDGKMPKEDLANEQMNRDINKENDGNRMPYPYQTEMDMNPTTTQQPTMPNPTNINHPYPRTKYEDQEGKFPFQNTLSMQDVKKINPVLGSKMERLGILFVDKSLFEKEYDILYQKCLRVAAERKVPVSEVFKEVL